MSQFKHKFSTKPARILKKLMVATVVSSAILTDTSAFAAVTAPLRTPNTQSFVYKATFNETAENTKETLDWRAPEKTLTFDIPAGNWVDSLELMLAGDPSGNVQSRVPLLVKFNNAKPVILDARARSFDARIKLSAKHIRQGENKITVTYRKPSGQACLSPDHGAWDIDLKNSFLVVKSRHKHRDVSIRDIKTQFKTRDMAPETVSLLTRGKDSLKLKALLAQGVAHRTNDIPDFRLSKGRSDIEIIAAPRDQLTNWVTDKDILTSEGAKVFVHEGRPLRLVITGDTEAQVLDMAQVFATHELPKTPRKVVSLGELELQKSFAEKKKTVTTRTSLSDLGRTFFDGGWGAKPTQLGFDVTDPATSFGKVTLQILNTKAVDARSRVNVKLNGHSLGHTKLNKTRKTVMFDVPNGLLTPVANQLTIEPVLKPGQSAENCGFKVVSPGLMLGDRSKIEISTNLPSPATDLSRFAASGAPFTNASGLNTQVILSGQNPSDMIAGLKVLATLAKTSGQSLTEADILRLDAGQKIATNKNTLLIGPKTRAAHRILAGAPKSLTTALTGQPIAAETVFQTASVERYASLDGTAVIREVAARKNGKARTVNGGLAGLYVSPQNKRTLVGVISATPGQSFARAADQLAQIDHWNKLSGSVARWNRSDVLMTQTAEPIPNFVVPETKKETPFTDVDFTKFSNIWDSTTMGLSDIAYNISEKLAALTTRPSNSIDLPDLTPPNAQTSVYAPTIAAQPTQTAAYIPATITPRVKPITIRPNVAVQAVRPPIALRGYSQIATVKPGSVNWRVLNAKLSDPKKWSTINWRDLALDDEVRAIKRKTRPLRKKVMKVLGSKPATQSTNVIVWGDKNISRPGLLLILAFIFVVILMGLSSPMSRLGNHH